MNLDNLQIGQKLYSAINGEVTFMGYIDDPTGKPYLICVEKNKVFSYYFIDGKADNEGIIVLFIQPIIHSSQVKVVLETEEQAERITKDIIRDIINMYENVIESPSIDCNDQEQIVEEIWQRLQ